MRKEDVDDVEVEIEEELEAPLQEVQGCFGFFLLFPSFFSRGNKVNAAVTTVKVNSMDCLCGIGLCNVGGGWKREDLPVRVMLLELPAKSLKEYGESHESLRIAMEKSVAMLNGLLRNFPVCI